MSDDPRAAAERPLSGSIRKLWPADRDELRDHLLRLDPESRRMRFAMPANDWAIERYARGALDVSGVAYGYFEDHVLRGAAELRPFEGVLPAVAEAAFSIETPWQNSGLGTELLGRLLLAARNRAIRTLYMTCLAENARMQAVARKHDAALRFEHGTVAGEIVQPYPTPLSLLREALDDSSTLMMAVFDLAPRPRDAA